MRERRREHFTGLGLHVGILQVQARQPVRRDIEGDGPEEWKRYPSQWFAVYNRRGQELNVVVFYRRDDAGTVSLRIIVRNKQIATHLFGADEVDRRFEPYTDEATPGDSDMVSPELTPPTMISAMRVAEETRALLTRRDKEPSPV